jgi:TRAP-type transport system periplasmic protein
MKKFQWFSLILVVSLVVGLFSFGCSSQATTATVTATATATATATTTAVATTTATATTTVVPDKVYTLRYGYSHPPTSADALFDVGWTKWITEQSKGQIQFKHFPSGQAAASNQLLAAVKNGVLDLADMGTGRYAGIFPLHELGQLPMIMPDAYAGGMAMWDLDQKYPEFHDEIASTGVTLIAYAHGGGGNFFTTKKPIKVLADLKGMILIETGIYNVQAAKLLGYTAEDVAPPEQYDAVAKGVVNGIDTNYVAHVNNSKTYETCNYATEVGLCGSDKFVVMNPATLASLPANLQKLFTDVPNVLRVQTAMGYQWDIANQKAKVKTEEAMKARGFGGIYTLPADEKAKWLAAVAPLTETWVKAASVKVGEAKARAILADAIKIYSTYSTTDQVKKDAEATLNAWGIAY